MLCFNAVNSNHTGVKLSNQSLGSKTSTATDRLLAGTLHLGSLEQRTSASSCQEGCTKMELKCMSKYTVNHAALVHMYITISGGAAEMD